MRNQNLCGSVLLIHIYSDVSYNSREGRDTLEGYGSTHWIDTEIPICGRCKLSTKFLVRKSWASCNFGMYTPNTPAFEILRQILRFAYSTPKRLLRGAEVSQTLCILGATQIGKKSLIYSTLFGCYQFAIWYFRIVPLIRISRILRTLATSLYCSFIYTADEYTATTS